MGRRSVIVRVRVSRLSSGTGEAVGRGLGGALTSARGDKSPGSKPEEAGGARQVRAEQHSRRKDLPDKTKKSSIPLSSIREGKERSRLGKKLILQLP